MWGFPTQTRSLRSSGFNYRGSRLSSLDGGRPLHEQMLAEPPPYTRDDRRNELSTRHWVQTTSTISLRAKSSNIGQKPRICPPQVGWPHGALRFVGLIAGHLRQQWVTPKVSSTSATRDHHRIRIIKYVGVLWVSEYTGHLSG
jgi:hypothetical protein